MRNVRHRDDVIGGELLHAQGLQERMTVRLALSDVGLPRIVGLGQKLDLSCL
jgi:hypothetical protein